MRVIVLGGTHFIGRAIVEELAAGGHEVLVVHRGQSEPADMPKSEHLHVDRAQLAGARADLAAFRPDAAVDTYSFGAADAANALGALPDGIRLLVLSSVDVYRAYTGLNEGRAIEPLPIDEDSPVRDQRFPLKGSGMPLGETYEKLEVEEAYLARGGTVIRLPMVYGEHDGQRREEFILHRVRAGRARIPLGTGAFLWTRGYVREMARGVVLALQYQGASGRVYNVGEARTASVRMWAEQILRAAGSEAELVSVAEEKLPPDLGVSATAAQHLLVSSQRAATELGFVHRDPEEAVAASVRWHLDHPPQQASDDFSADDAALESATA